MEISQPIIVSTFHTSQSPGSKQYLHIFQSLTDRDQALEAATIEDEFDHSFAYLDNGALHVEWRNKAGIIQFCGSGAYSLAWYFCVHLSLGEVIIKTDTLSLSAAVDESRNLMLKISKRKAKQFKKESTYQIFTEEGSGVYLVELSNIESVSSSSITKLHQMIGDEDIHGVCAFYWDQSLQKGYLNYYTPRHGRDQDYVTGSIHQYLAAIVENNTGTQKQHWKQLSSSPGELSILCGKGHVQLYGHCKIQS